MVWGNYQPESPLGPLAYKKNNSPWAVIYLGGLLSKTRGFVGGLGKLSARGPEVPEG